MPTSSSHDRPLFPTYRIERALIEEHTRLLAGAHAKWGGKYPICPDCYKPPHLCAHMNLKLQP